MQDGTALDFVILCRFLVVHLFPGEYQPLLLRRYAFFFFYSFFDAFYFVGGLDIDFYFFAGESFNFYEHFTQLAGL